MRSTRPFRTAAFTLVLSLALCQSALAVSVTRGPYLQTGSPTSVTVRWRTDSSTDSCVRYGTSSGSLTGKTCVSSSVTEHVVKLSSLSANTKYYYSIGVNAGPIAGDSSYFFVTAPPTGTAKPTRIWVLGDSGTGSSEQRAVRDRYYSFTGSRHTDLWLMLGDNAYSDGTDSQYQSTVFGATNGYPTMLRKSVLWPTLGNHDAHSADSSSQSGPYYDIFTLPKNGEAGGVASGTEAYYSFNYGNIHFVCLDSADSSRSPTGSMLTWLKADLAATSQQWIIAFWHHPPYSKGSHNSDSESDLEQMRQYALPILEGRGVDLVLAGHSHSYERSFLLDGHYGSSSSLTAAMIKDGGDGKPGGDGAYAKPAGLVAHKGAVYAVNGSSGHTGGGSLNHPAMYVSLNVVGSMILDVNGNRLDAKFLNGSGSVQDSFTIQKGSGTPSSFNFSLGNTGSKSVARGSSVTNIIRAALVSGTAQSVSFSVSGLPAGVTKSFSPTACLPTTTGCPTTLTLTAATSTLTGTYPLTVTGTGGGISKTTSFNLTVTVPGSTTTTRSFQDGVLPSASYSGTRDTRIVRTAPGTNYGTATTIWVDGDDGNLALLKWGSLNIPAGSVVKSATITLNVTNLTNGTYNLYALKRNWVETGATWNQYASGSNWQVPGAKGTLDRGLAVLGTVTAPSLGKRTITLNAAGIALVQSWVNFPNQNHGLIIDKPTVTDAMAFDSRNASTASNRPKLTVTYVAP